MFYNSEVYGDATNTALVPDWWRFDLMAAYKVTPHVTLQLNIYNITDELYYINKFLNVWYVTGQPGRPREYAVTVRRRF